MSEETTYLREARGATEQGIEMFVIKSLKREEFYRSVLLAAMACEHCGELRITIKVQEWRY